MIEDIAISSIQMQSLFVCSKVYYCSVTDICEVVLDESMHALSVYM